MTERQPVAKSYPGVACQNEEQAFYREIGRDFSSIVGERRQRMTVAAQNDKRRFVDSADAILHKLRRLRAQVPEWMDKDSREKNKAEKQLFMAEHGVP